MSYSVIDGLVSLLFSNFANTVKLVDPENPLFGARIWVVSHRSRVMGNFFVQIAATGYRGDKGQSVVNLKDAIRLADPEKR